MIDYDLANRIVLDGLRKGIVKFPFEILKEKEPGRRKTTTGACFRCGTEFQRNTTNTKYCLDCHEAMRIDRRAAAKMSVAGP
jgi:hypothetical protein